MPDLTLVGLLAVAAALTQWLKGYLPDDPRNRWTPLLAIALSVGASFTFLLAAPVLNLERPIVVQAIVNGIVGGLAAVGLWNTQFDLSGKNKQE